MLMDQDLLAMKARWRGTSACARTESRRPAGGAFREPARTQRLLRLRV